MISLGQASNYSLGQVFRHLFALGTRRDSDRLRTALAERYQVEPSHVALYHTGRSALSVAIASAAKNKPMHVIIPGFTCIAVVRAIKAAGCTPVFVDITPTDLAYNYAKLDQKLQSLAISATQPTNPKSLSQASDHSDQKTPAQPVATPEQTPPIDKKDEVCYNGSIILVQNTLGISWNMQKIQSIAKNHHAKIVEDLAHSAGRFYADGREVGTVGEAAALSFGKGKAIDTISGGAVILRHATVEPPLKKPRLADRLRDRWYPLFGAVVRALGKPGQFLMCGLVKTHLVQRSADAELDTSRRLTHWQAKLALKQLAKLPSTHLRDYHLVTGRDALLTELRQNGYNFSETWYDTPVSPKRYMKEVDFPAQECPAAVKISEQIVNLPTWYPPDKLQRASTIIKKYEVK